MAADPHSGVLSELTRTKQPRERRLSIDDAQRCDRVLDPLLIRGCARAPSRSDDTRRPSYALATPQTMAYSLCQM